LSPELHCRFLDWCAGEQALNLNEVAAHGRPINDQLVKKQSKRFPKQFAAARVGLKNLNRPIASFVFSGPTGVGKPKLASLAAAGSEAMIRLDMSEYMGSTRSAS